MKLFAPYINDITTDVDNPPAFVDAPQGEFRFAKRVREGYPSLRGLETEADPASTFKSALQLARTRSDWTIKRADEGAGAIQAVATTKLLRFRDDIVIRITANDAGSRVDMRSASRIGRSDFGANAERIAAFLGDLRRELGR